MDYTGKTLHIDIVSAEEELFSGEARMVTAPASMGEIGILPGHTPLLTRLNAGEIRLLDADGRYEYFYVEGGLLEVQPFLVTVLADTALRASDIDAAAARAAKERAERALQERAADCDCARAYAELLKATAQLRALERAARRRTIG